MTNQQEEMKRTALEKSLEHWKDNVKKFNAIDPDAWANNQLNWFDKNCEASQCALCSKFLHAQSITCLGCPLDDPRGPCCTEWRKLKNACKREKATIENVQAVTDRIQHELNTVNNIE